MKKRKGANAGANVPNLNSSMVSPSLLPLTLPRISNSASTFPQSSEKQEQQEKEKGEAEASWQSKGENIAQFEVNVEGDVLLGLSITEHHGLLAVHLLILHLLLIAKDQLRACNHPCAGDSQKVKPCVGGGEVEAGQGGG